MGRDQSPIEVVETAFVLASTDRYKVSACPSFVVSSNVGGRGAGRGGQSRQSAWGKGDGACTIRTFLRTLLFNAFTCRGRLRQ